MADVRVRDLDEKVVAELKAQAKRHGRTLGDELRDILIEATRRPRREWAERLAKLRASIRAEHGVLPDSMPGIRAWRDGCE